MNETRSTCPYCGVGCGVIIESEGAQITGVRGDPEHPGELRPPVHQGLHAAPDGQRRTSRANAPAAAVAARARAARRPRRIGWDAALDALADRSPHVHRATRPGRGRLLRLGPVADRGLLRLQQARQGPARHQQHRHQLAAVHVAARSPATRRRSAPTRRPRATTTSTDADCIFIAGSNTAWAHPDPVPPDRGREGAQPGDEDHRGRPAPHRHGRDAPTCTCRIQPGTDVALFHGMLHLMLWEGWTTARLHRARTPAASRRSRPSVRDCTPDTRCAGLRHRQGGPVHGGAAGSRRSARDAVAVLPGPQPVVVRHGQERGADQPAPRHRRRSAGPAPGRSRSPASPTRWADAKWAAWPTCCPRIATSPTRSIARKSRRCGASTTCRQRPGKTAVEMFEAAADGEIKALWIACTNPAQSMPDQATVRRALERCRVRRACRKPSPPPPPRLTPTCCCRPPPGARRNGTVTNSERRITPRARGRAAAGRGARTTGASPRTSRAALEARLRPDGATLFPVRSTPSRSGTSTAKPRAAATSTSPA